MGNVEHYSKSLISTSQNSWRFKCFPFLIFLFDSIGLHKCDLGVTPCENFNSSVKPYIYPLNRALAQYASDGDPRKESVNFEDTGADNNIFESRQFNCTHDSPIRWVFHLDPLDSSMNIYLDFTERVRVVAESNKTSENYSVFYYTANLKLLFHPNDLNRLESTLFSCEPYDPSKLACGERNFLQAIRTRIEIFPTSSPRDNELAIRLMNATLDDVSKEPVDLRNCQSILLIKVEKGNFIKYKWQKTFPDVQEAYKTNSTTFLENAFRLSEPKLDYGCTETLPDSDSCEKCIHVGDPSDEAWNITKHYAVNGVVFYGKFQDGFRIHRGHFSIPTFNHLTREFYFDWEMTMPLIAEKMIQLMVPTLAYANVSFEVKCHVSVFHFSYGTMIETSEDEILLKRHTEKFTFHEIWNPYGYREISHMVSFIETGKEKKVGCVAPLKRSKEVIRKTATVRIEDPIPAAINGLAEKISELLGIEEGKEGLFIDCNTTGNPEPELNWMFPKSIGIEELDELEITDGGNFNRIKFPTWRDAFAGTYICSAKNRFGLVTRSITLQTNEDGVSNFVVIISSTMGTFALLLGFVIGFLVWKIRKQRLDFEKQTQKAIEEFRNGIKVDGSDENLGHVNFPILQLPYDTKFEVKKESWLIEDKILGSGQFGLVRMGSVLMDGRRVKVAVKTLKSTEEINEFKNFLFELKIMAYLGQHRNIVSLVAACTEEIDDRDILIGVEFCDNGCLLNFLRKYRATFRNMVTEDGKLITNPTQIQSTTQNESYANISSYTMSTYDLFRWAYHIASGMDYLRVKKVLHGDLAARNVLLTLRKVAKVGDFGLSRVLSDSENYTKKTQTALPWKWMAIESLRDRVFSTQTDVWAYGITLYELFTLGQSPYPGIAWSPDFNKQLENGMRMERPIFCPLSIYKIMRQCWDNIPSHRPGYSRIKRKLSQGLRRLSVIANSPTLPQPQSNSNGQTSQATSTSNSLIINVNEDEVGQIYSNIQRSTMNYYKNI